MNTSCPGSKDSPLSLSPSHSAPASQWDRRVTQPHCQVDQVGRQAGRKTWRHEVSLIAIKPSGPGLPRRCNLSPRQRTWDMKRAAGPVLVPPRRPTSPSPVPIKQSVCQVPGLCHIPPFPLHPSPPLPHTHTFTPSSSATPGTEVCVIQRVVSVLFGPGNEVCVIQRG